MRNNWTVFVIIALALFGFILCFMFGVPHTEFKRIGAIHPTKMQELTPGVYEYQNVWFTGINYVAPVRLVTITSKDEAQHYLEFVPSTDQWMVLDLGDISPVPGRNNKKQRFTGLFEVSGVDRKKIISVYLPFIGTNNSSTNASR